MRNALALIVVLAVTPSQAMEFGYDAYVDLRLIAPGSERSWLEGGLGKLRYDTSDSAAQFSGGLVEGWAYLTPELRAVAVLRADQDQKDFVLPLEAYLRYRPVSTEPWRWSVKAGAFFPPFSLENTELGWTSYWTVTPSAINSWFGDELRTIGAEGDFEWRNDLGKLSLIGALYGWNDPAGVLIAERGWSLDDFPTALFDEPRRPDATLILFGAPYPDTTTIFQEIDHRVGWYGGVDFASAESWRLQLFRYDNEADPSAHKSDYFAWHTDFWEGGASTTLDAFTFLAQGLAGTTVIEPTPGFADTTRFSSAYALVGWEDENWRLAGRGDVFRTNNSRVPALSENGYALTASVAWLPREWLRLSAETIYVDSKRNERSVVHLAPDQSETQFQLSARIYL